MPQFRKKPVVIEAEQYTAYGKLVRGMCNSISCYTSGNTSPHVHTIHDNQLVNLEVGDFVIPEPDGEHFYPCKPDIFEATYEPASTPSQQVEAGWQEIAKLRAKIINSPETADYMAGVPLEAAHQRDRWGAEHDAGKSPYDWFWLIGYLAQKAADAAVRGDAEKAMHHTISTGAALANWHAALSGKSTAMRPGIAPPALTPEEPKP